MSAFFSARASLAAAAWAVTATAVLHRRRVAEETAYDATDALTSSEGQPIVIRQDRVTLMPRASGYRRPRQSGIIGARGSSLMWRP